MQRYIRDRLGVMYAMQELYSALFNIWVLVVLVYALNSPYAATITNTVFYGIPKIIILAVIGGCAVLSCVSLILNTPFVKLWSIFFSIVLYLWIAYSSFRFSPFSLTAGTYFILATRYIIVYLRLRARGYA